METFSEKQQLQLQEIKDWAIENGNQISYLTLQDMLKYEKQPITDDETVINRIVHELIEQGINVEPLVEGETYQAQAEEQEEICACAGEYCTCYAKHYKFDGTFIE